MFPKPDASGLVPEKSRVRTAAQKLMDRQTDIAQRGLTASQKLMDHQTDVCQIQSLAVEPVRTNVVETDGDLDQCIPKLRLKGACKRRNHRDLAEAVQMTPWSSVPNFALETYLGVTGADVILGIFEEMEVVEARCQRWLSLNCQRTLDLMQNLADLLYCALQSSIPQSKPVARPVDVANGISVPLTF